MDLVNKAMPSRKIEMLMGKIEALDDNFSKIMPICIVQAMWRSIMLVGYVIKIKFLERYDNGLGE